MSGRTKPVNPAAFDDRPFSIPRTNGPQTGFERVRPVSSRGELEEKSDKHRFFFLDEVQFLQKKVQQSYTAGTSGPAKGPAS
jgi:hypothetical protein